MGKIILDRTLTEEIKSVSNNFKALVLVGPRQVGKTTLLNSIREEGRKIVDLSNISLRELACADPSGFLSTYSPPVFIDEVQYAPELFSYMRMLLDSSDDYGQIWMSGSQQFEMMNYVSDSLAGRLAIVQLQGMSIYERESVGNLQKPFLPSREPPKLLKHKNSTDTFKIIWQGSFPEVIPKDKKSRRTFFESYIRTYIERDVRKIINVRDEMSFRTFLRVVAARTGLLLNLDDIAKDVNISPNTARQWLSILRTSGLVYLLSPFSKNITKRLAKTPKLYFLDTGLAAYLAGWTTAESLETGISSCAFFETFVIGEILKSHWHNGEYPEVYFYRDSDGKEIDLLIYQDNVYYPIEIKKHGTPSPKDIASFKTFSNIPQIDIGYGCEICLTPQVIPLSADCSAISIWDI